MWNLAKTAVLLAAQQVASAIFLAAISEAFLKKVALYALRKLAKSTKNQLDDELVRQVEKQLDKKQ